MPRLHSPVLSLLVCACAVVGAGAVAWAQQAEPAKDARADEQAQIKALSARMDALYRAKSSKGQMAMHITTPQYKRTLRMEITTLGMAHTLIRILEPKKERGISTLKKGDQMWNYLPKVKKEVRVPPSMMMGSWMGSDVTNDDLVRSSSWEQDYEAKIDHTASDKALICVQYTPRPTAAVTWSKVVGCFDRASQLPTKQSFYDEKGREARQMTFSAVKDIGGRTIPTKMTITPLLGDKKGNQTTIEYEQMSFDVPVSEQTFSLANLRRGF